MKLPFFASFIIFIVVLTHRIHRQRNEVAKKEKDFWAREEAANFIRKKPLDNLDYINIPISELPTDIMTDNEEIVDCINIVQSLSSEKIVNFTGYTNTDLKFEYGTANIDILSNYDQNYTTLVCTLQKWADLLITGGFDKEASKLMEFAVSTHTDVSRTYYKLADYYVKTNQKEKIQQLIDTAQGLKSENHKRIVETLNNLT